MPDDSQAPPVNYAPPPTHFPPTPRNVRMKTIPLSVFLPIAVIVDFMLIGVASSYFWLDRRRLKYTAVVVGTTAPGEITDKVKSGARKSRYRLSFDFKDDGVVQSTENLVPADIYNTFKVGDAVVVRYLRLAPRL